MDTSVFGRGPVLAALLALSVFLPSCALMHPSRVRLKVVFPVDISGNNSVDEETRRTQDAVGVVSADFKPFFLRSGEIYFPEVELEYPLTHHPNTSLTLHIGGTRSVSADEDTVYSLIPIRVRTSTHASFFEGGVGIRHYLYEDDQAKLSLIARLTGYHYRINQSITIAGLYNFHRDIEGEGLEVDFGFGGEANNHHPWFRWIPEGFALGLDATYSTTVVSDLGSADRWNISVSAVHSFQRR